MPVETRAQVARRLAAEAAAAASGNASPRLVNTDPFRTQRVGENTLQYHIERTRYERERIRSAQELGITLPRSQPNPINISDETLRNVKEILEENVASLYSSSGVINNDIYNILTPIELEYLRNDTILSNYFLRNFEFIYTIDMVDNFNSLLTLIDIDKDNITDTNRPDIAYYYEINKILSQISKDFTLISNRANSTRLIVRDLLFKLSNEKQILNNLIRSLNVNIQSLEAIQTIIMDPNRRSILRDRRSLTTEEQIRLASFRNFKGLLETRLRKINGIREIQLKELINNGEEYENTRMYLKRVIKAASILGTSFYKLFINIGILRNVRDVELKNLIIDDMMDSIEYYMNTINHANDADENNYIISLELQNNHLGDITDNGISGSILTATDVGNYIRDISSFIRNQQLDSNLEQAQLRAAEERLRIINMSTDDSLTINRNRIARRRARADALLAARDQREIQRENRRREREARRQALLAERQARRQSRSTSLPVSRAPRAVRAPVSINIEFKNDDFEKNDQVEASFERDTSTIREASYQPFLNEIKRKYVDLRSNVKASSKKTLNDNYKNLKVKYATIFNRDEPVNSSTGIPSIKNYVGNSIVSLFVRYMNFGKDMKFNDNSRYYVTNHTLTRDESNDFSEQQQRGIDAGGLRRDFMTSLTSEFFDKRILINRDGTDKYFLNPEFEPDDFMKYIIKKNIRSSNDAYFDNRFIDDFYEFLGQLLLFVLVNDCGLDKYISSYIIKSFCSNDELDDDDYVSFMINDFPAEFTATIKSMEKPEEIEYFGTAFNDYYLLDEDSNEGDDLTRDNIIDFIRKTAKFMMTKTILRKDIEIRPGQDFKKIFEKGEKINTLLIQGIPTAIREEFKTNNFCPTVINSYIKTPDMNREIIGKLITKFQGTMPTVHNYRGNADLQRLAKLFKEYVLEDKGRKHANEENYFKFIINLLKFWSASSFYKDEGRYKIAINAGLSNTHLPSSHTCFFTIDLPNYTQISRNATDEEIGNYLFNKVEIAISNVESGIGNAGGGYRSSSRKIRNTRR